MADVNEQSSYKEIEILADYLKQRVSIEPKIGIICGSGLGSIGEILSHPQSFDYREIPNFPWSTVESHAGKLLFGHIKDTSVICMQGRFHFYEGYSMKKCVLPIRLMKLLGVKVLILSNAAGSLNPAYKVGDIMLIKDHINLVGFSGFNPLRGQNVEKFGPRFVALNDVYNAQILTKVKNVAKDLGLSGLHEGIYACVAGPNFETVAELKALRILGADVVGMSTVHEVIAAKHCDLTCFAFSLITNECVMDYENHKKPNHEEILLAATKRENDLKLLIQSVIPHLLNK